MKTKLEKDAIMYTYLESFEHGYCSGDFSNVFPCLAEDCIMESQWVLTPHKGYRDVVDYLTEKGEALKRSGAFPSCAIVELVGDMNPIKDADFHVNGEKTHGSFGLLYNSGELCLLMEQAIDDKIEGVMLRIKLTDDHKIARVDLCDPELFQYRDFYTFVTFIPSLGDESNNVSEGKMRVSEPYYSEFYLFLGMVGEDFDEYEDMNIPMEKWIAFLEKWKRFYSFKTFDEAFEDACGIDYSNFTAENRVALRRLSNAGDDIWANRHNNPTMLYALIEWTEKYSKICDTVNSYGF